PRDARDTLHLSPSGRGRIASEARNRLGRGNSPSVWRALAVSSAIWLGSAFTAAIAQAPPTPPLPPGPQQRVTIGFVEIEGDPRHEPLKAYERLTLKTRDHPYAGAQVGIEEAAALTRVLRTDFALERITVKSADEVPAAVTKALAERDMHFFIVDAPADAF